MTLYVETFDRQLTEMVNTERQADYGHPADHFRIAAQIKAALSSCSDLEMKHILEVLADKMARLCHSPEHYDSWLDIAGYARTAMMVMDRRNEK